MPVNDLLNLRSLPGLQNPPEALCHIIIHRQLPGACVRLGLLNHILHVAGALELVIDVENPVLQVNIPDGQSAELRNPDPGVEQDVNHVVVLAVTVVIMDGNASVIAETQQSLRKTTCSAGIHAAAVA